jgi:histidinol phosphatase-like enzyme
MVKLIHSWWIHRKLIKAVSLLQRAGLHVVRLKEVAGTEYLVKEDGTMLKLVPRK